MAALASGGWLVAIVVGVLSFGGGAVVENQTEVVDEVIARSPLAFECPEGWTVTDGVEPDSGADIISCASPDKRYIITTRGGEPPQAFDTLTGQFVDAEQFR